MCRLEKEASRGDQIENTQYFVDKVVQSNCRKKAIDAQTFNETIQEMLKTK